MVTDAHEKLRDHLFIEEWMKARGFSDETLAEKLKTSRVTVYRWRTDQKRLNPSKIAVIANALGCSPEDLWRKPERPSIDAMLSGATDDLAQKASEMVGILLRDAS